MTVRSLSAPRGDEQGSLPVAPPPLPTRAGASCRPRPRLALGLLTLAAASLTSGCTTGATSSAAITLRLASGDSGRALAPHRELTEQFCKAEPGVQVRLEAVSGGDYYTRLLTQYAAGGAADVVQLGDDAVSQFVCRGALQPLDTYRQSGEPLLESAYLPGVLAPGRWKGHQYLLPKDFTPVGVFCNAAVFRKKGLPLPKEGWTWEQFRTTARLLTSDDDGDGKTDTWGVVLPGPVASHLELWTAGAGAGVVHDDGSYSGAMDGPAALEAVHYARTMLLEDRSAPGPQELGTWEGGNRYFEQGKAGMWVTGRWPQPGLVESFKGDLVVVPPPVHKAPSNILFWSGFAISAQCKHPAEAWRFLRNHAGPQASRVWRQWALPASSELVAREHLASDPLDGPWIRAIAQTRPRAFTHDPYWSRIGEPAAREIMETAVLLPEQDVDAAVHAIVRRAEEERRRVVQEEGP